MPLGRQLSSGKAAKSSKMYRTYNHIVRILLEPIPLDRLRLLSYDIRVATADRKKV